MASAATYYIETAREEVRANRAARPNDRAVSPTQQGVASNRGCGRATRWAPDDHPKRTTCAPRRASPATDPSATANDTADAATESHRAAPASDTTNQPTAPTAPTDRSIVFGESASPATGHAPANHSAYRVATRIAAAYPASCPPAQTVRHRDPSIGPARTQQATPTASPSHRATQEVNRISTDAAVA